MGTKTKTVELFAKEVLARLKNDDDSALAHRISRKCLAAVDSQLAALNAKKVDLEADIEDALEKLKDAKFPETVPTSGSSYISRLGEAQNKAESLQDQLTEIENSITFFNKFLMEF